MRHFRFSFSLLFSVPLNDAILFLEINHNDRRQIHHKIFVMITCEKKEIKMIEKQNKNTMKCHRRRKLAVELIIGQKLTLRFAISMEM